MSTKVIIMTDGSRGFFERGKEVAKLADQGKPIPEKCIINFDSPDEMIDILTKTRRNVMTVLRERDASITEIAKKLRRDRASVAKDIKLLEHYGLITTHEEVNPGHGLRKIAHVISKQPIHLETFI